jgi:hypothetical protein
MSLSCDFDGEGSKYVPNDHEINDHHLKTTNEYNPIDYEDGFPTLQQITNLRE